jgi:hypothetical protein
MENNHNNKEPLEISENNERYSFCLLRNSIIDSSREVKKKEISFHEDKKEESENEKIIVIESALPYKDFLNSPDQEDTNTEEKELEKKKIGLNEMANEIISHHNKKEIININKIPSYEADIYLKIEENKMYENPDILIDKIREEYDCKY